MGNETKVKETEFKDTLFIGSSSEGLSTAQAIKEQFDKEMDVTLWNEGVFKMNASYLESLLRASNSFDFAILVFTPDDLVTSRSQTQSVPRDNVIFEHGLFLGRLGPNRAFIVCEETTKVLSDYAGITIATYREREDGSVLAAVGSACNRIRTAIEQERQQPKIGVLPSTALAVGYFENFVSKVVPALGNKRELQMKRQLTDAEGKPTKDAEGKPMVERCRLNYDSFVLHIVIPSKLSDVSKDNLQLRVSNLVHISIETPFRDFPFYIRSKDYNPESKSALSVFDIPTTLLASRKAVELILGGGSIGLSPDQKNYERREIRNFELTLRKLIEKEYDEDNPYVKIESMAYLTSL
jgi:hypothetical protein